MRLVLLQGPGEISSRKKLSEIREKFDGNSVATFESGADSVEILGNFSTPSLFDLGPRLVILENPNESLFSKKIILDSSESFNLVIWVEKELGEKSEILKFVKENKGEILTFPESKEVSVFPFLEALTMGEKRALIELKKLTDAGFDFQYILTMVFYQLRSLAVTPKRAPDFVKNKLNRQRANFSPEKITSLYKSLLETDFKIKSGLLEKEQAYFNLVSGFVNFR